MVWIKKVKQKLIDYTPFMPHHWKRCTHGKKKFGKIDEGRCYWGN